MQSYFTLCYCPSENTEINQLELSWNSFDAQNLNNFSRHSKLVNVTRRTFLDQETKANVTTVFAMAQIAYINNFVIGLYTRDIIRCTMSFVNSVINTSTK